MRAQHEGDASYVKHLTPDEHLVALQGLAEKGYVDEDAWNPDTGEWDRVRSSAL